MCDKVKNDLAVVQIIGAIGSASHSAKFVIDRSDARKICDELNHLVSKIKHQLSAARESESPGKALKA